MNASIKAELQRLLAHLESPNLENGRAELLNGSVVCESGILRVTDPKAGGRHASVVSTAQVRIVVNGQEAVQPAEVRQADRLEVRFLHDKAYELTVADDAMRAYLHVFTENMYERRLADCGPTFFYVPQSELVPLADKATIVAQVRQEIQEMAIISPIEEEALQEALHAPFRTAVVVASGKPAKLGRDGYIETMFPHATEQVIADWQRKVDYRDHGLIPSVAGGDTIAIIHRAVPGESGGDLFGREVPPTPVSDVKVELRRNVRMDDTGRVIALKAGRPSLTGDTVKIFDIQTVHIVEGDVDLTVGNVLFNGDVLIQGDVQEGMRVEATGNITVLGNAFSAVLVSCQHVYIHGHATKSQLYGGRLGLLYSKAYELIGKIMAQYDALEKETNAAHEMAEKKGLHVTIGQIASLLIQNRHPGLHGVIGEFSELIASAGAMIPLEFKLLVRMLRLFGNKELLDRINNWNDVQKIHDYLLLSKVQIENSVFEESDIVLGFSNMSQLETNGSLVVTGQGLLNCQVTVNKNCLFKNPDSSIKGGRIVAKGRIHAFEAGTPFGRNTYLEVGESVKLNKAEGVIIKVGDRVVQIPEERHDLYFSLDKQGNLHQEKNRHRERRA
ncbi:UNVERIFIED_CONTAM: uncharacterized protein (DUF342 family) [Brevibacillus sp. OAP136]